jgi:hypothetical protein
MKFLNFFLLFWVVFDLLDPYSDPDSENTDLIESGFNPDPDPKHWLWIIWIEEGKQVTHKNKEISCLKEPGSCIFSLVG